MTYAAAAAAFALTFFSNFPQANCSWFGDYFHGKPTASGITFNEWSWTCASPYLPLGSLVWCYNEDTGLWFILRVIDRGPYAVDGKGRAKFPLEPHPTRQFDLSKLAFFALSGGDLDRGTLRVRYAIIGRDISDMLYPGPYEADLEGMDVIRQLIILSAETVLRQIKGGICEAIVSAAPF